MKHLHFIFLFLLSLHSFSSFAQNPPHFKIGEEQLHYLYNFTLHQGEDQILYTGTHRGLFKYQHGEFIKIKDYDHRDGDNLFQLKRNSKGELFCCTAGGQIFKVVGDELELFYEAEINHKDGHFFFYFDSQDNIIYKNKYFSKVFVHENNRLETYRTESTHLLGNFFQISPDHFILYDRLENQFYDFKNDTIINRPQLSNRFKNLAVSGFFMVDTTLFISSLEKDNPNYYQIHSYNQAVNTDSLKFNIKDSFYPLADGSVACLYNSQAKGLGIFKIENGKLVKKSHLVKNHYISTITQNWKGDLILGTFKKGLIIIPNPKSKVALDLQLDSVTVNNKKINIDLTHEFEQDEKSFNFYLNMITVTHFESTSLFYQLEGLDKEWTTTNISDHIISYKTLPPGNYTFKAYTKYHDRESDLINYSFKIYPPIWQRWWFVTLAISFIALIFYLLLQVQTRRLNRINKIALEKEKQAAEKQLVEKQKIELELKAIRSQMNPHFIFNALNSIQHLVLKGDVDQSYSFINKFANLVRKTLEFSEVEFITLEEEINLLEVYLTLEQLRFKDHFEFKIIKPENLEISIPPMLIQPFIENAIIHGLLHKKGQKRLIVNFQFKEQLICCIEDNGIGRVKAKAIKERQAGSHKSFSLNAIKRRFEILKNYYKGDLGYEYQDFEPSNDEQMTTKVLLKIPFRVVRKK